MIRAFVALDPPPDIRGRLGVLQFMLPLPARVDPGDFHLTLTYLGEVPDAVLVQVDEGLQALRMERFSIALSGAGLFGGGAPRAAHAAVAPSGPLARLQAKVDRIARGAGVALPARRFVPHVTLGRFAPPPPEDRLRLERAVIEEGGFRAGPWEVEEVTLFRSHPGAREARYEALARYPLE